MPSELTAIRLRFLLNQVGLPSLLDGPEQFHVSATRVAPLGFKEPHGDGIVVLTLLQRRHDQVGWFKMQELSCGREASAMASRGSEGKKRIVERDALAIAIPPAAAVGIESHAEV